MVRINNFYIVRNFNNIIMTPCHICKKSTKLIVTARLSDDGKTYYYADICQACVLFSESEEENPQLIEAQIRDFVYTELIT